MAGAFGWHSSGCERARLWRALPLVAVLALACGGCSISTQLDSFFGGDGDKAETTGSVAEKGDKLPPENDLAFAKAAASELLKKGKKDASLPWENPRSGARGTVTSLASAYVQEGRTCQNFLASYVSGRSESWLQGEACKEGKGNKAEWQVRSIKPWKSS